jgi:hypothetical protein
MWTLNTTAAGKQARDESTCQDQTCVDEYRMHVRSSKVLGGSEHSKVAAQLAAIICSVSAA